MKRRALRLPGGRKIGIFRYDFFQEIVPVLWFALVAVFLAAPALAFPVERCVNLGNALDSPEREGEWGYTIGFADIDAVAEAGFDTIRLPVRFSSRWDGERVDEAFQARVDEVARYALDRGLTVLLDLHHFDELTADPAGQADSFVALWGYLSDHYAGWPDGLVFELLNEPHGDLTTDLANDLYTRVLPGIRETHPERWVVVSGSNWGSIKDMHALDAFDARTVPTFHYYAPWPFTHQQAAWLPNPPPAAEWGSDEERRKVREDMARAANRGGPVFLGEFGVNTRVPAEARWDWTRAVREAAEAEGIGWCVWNLTSTFRIYDENQGTWEDGALGALFD
ncbi:MAG: glycoside hydrolase family 5 protein [Pseudomonadota bacterium]